MSAFRLIAAEKAEHPISLMAEVLGVSRSGFHAWQGRAPSDRQLGDAWLLEQIKEIWSANREVYGAPRIHAELRMARGICVSRKRVERLMREAQISGLVPKKRGRTTIRVPGVRVADDLVERDFRPEGPNQLWVADITYVRTVAGFCYVSFITDVFTRRIVGWAVSATLHTAGLPLLALEHALLSTGASRDRQGLIHHSDRGSQYVSLKRPGFRSDPTEGESEHAQEVHPRAA